tara:strand:- start:158 stop:490 length:333 start_codon:yes stop_codon:yes gene_type:complete
VISFGNGRGDKKIRGHLIEGGLPAFAPLPFGEVVLIVLAESFFPLAVFLVVFFERPLLFLSAVLPFFDLPLDVVESLACESLLLDPFPLPFEEAPFPLDPLPLDDEDCSL